MRLVRFVAICQLLVGCGGALSMPTAADEQAIAKQWPGTTKADLEKGRSAYVERCAGCHALPLPEEYPAQAWLGIMDRMAPKASLSDKERIDILRFTQATSTRLHASKL